MKVEKKKDIKHDQKKIDILVFNKYFYFVFFAVTFLSNSKQLNFRLESNE